MMPQILYSSKIRVANEWRQIRPSVCPKDSSNVSMSRFIDRLLHDQSTVHPIALDDPDPRANHQLIYQEIKGYTNRQYEQMDTLDAKGGLIAATSTALTAGFVALFNGLATATPSTRDRVSIIPLTKWTVSNHILLYILLSVAFVTYLTVLAVLMLAVRTRKWEIVPDPKVLVDEYWGKTANQTLADLCATMAATAQDNQRTLDDKMRWIGRSFLLLGADVFILFLAILAGVWAGLL